MKKLLTLVLVMVLVLTSLTACSVEEITGKLGGVKDAALGVVDTVKKTVGGWLGIEFPDEDKNEKNPLESASSIIFDLYKDKAKETSATYTLVSVVTVDGVAYPVTWTSDNEAIKITANEDPNLVNIVIPELGDAEIAYKLTATITDAENNKVTREFSFVVPKFAVNTAAEYYAKESGNVVIEGLVSGISSKSQKCSINAIYVQDAKGEGGYYVYEIADGKDPVADLNIKIGNTVRVSGEKVIYSGTHEIKGAVIEVLDATEKAVTPVDFTKIYTDAEKLTDEALVAKQGMLVTIKGVEITGQKESSGYYNFKLAGKESYIRISSSTCFINADDQKTFKDAHTANKGSFADATGIITVYQNAFYLVPVSVDAYSNFKMPERNDDEKLAFEKDNLKLPTEIKTNTVIDLPATGITYSDVKISWKSDNACAVVADGKLTVTLPDAAATVKLTATLELNGKPLEAVFEIAVSAKPTVVPSEVTTLVEGTAYKFFYYQPGLGNLPYYFDGTVPQYYGNMTDDLSKAVDMYIENGEGGFYIYFNDAANENKKTYLEIFITYNEEQARYYSNVRVTTVKPASVFVMDATHGLPVVTLKEGEKDVKYFFGTYGDKTDLRPTDYEKYVTSETNALGKFCELVDVGSISSADKLAYEKDALGLSQNEFAEDATLTLPTTPAQYSDVVITWKAEGAEIGEGNKIAIVIGDAAYEFKLIATLTCGDADPVTREFTVKVASKKLDITSIPDAIAKYKAGETGKYYIAGVVTSITNTTYGNMYVQDQSGQNFLIYGIYGEAGAKYNTLGLDIKVGEYIVVYGEMGEYKGTPQLLNSTFVKRYTPDTYADASAAGAGVTGTDGKDLSAEEYTLTGTITSMVNTKYGNFYIKDADGNEMYIYGLYYGDVRYDAMAVKPVVGDTVTVRGYMTKFVKNETTTIQMVSAQLLGLNIAPCTEQSTTVYEGTTPVTAPVADTAYQLYALNFKAFVNGKLSSSALSSTDKQADAVTIYLEAVEGKTNEFYIYVIESGNKNYINLTANSTKAFAKSATKSSVWTFDSAKGGFYTTISDKIRYISAFKSTSNVVDFRAYYESNLSDSDKEIATLVAPTPVTTTVKVHVFGGDCDTTCNTEGCAHTRIVGVDHKFDNDCADVTCNACGETAREAAEHVYDNDCADTTCANCAATREAKDHAFDNCEDTDCANCAVTREPQAHVYDADCTDATCNNAGCQVTREAAAAHVYDADCTDTTCNNAGCQVTREAAAHVYDADCTDTTCNNEGCEVTREAAAHVYDDDCTDTTCNNAGCEVTREAAEHVYDDCNDTTCAKCAVTREAQPHVYTGCDDATCENCDHTREAGNHNFTGKCGNSCTECGAADPNAKTCVDSDKNGHCDNCGCDMDEIGDTPVVDN